MRFNNERDKDILTLAHEATLWLALVCGACIYFAPALAAITSAGPILDAS